MSINFKKGMTVSVNLSVEPIELNEDCGASLILTDNNYDLQEMVIDCIEKVTIEANKRLVGNRLVWEAQMNERLNNASRV